MSLKKLFIALMAVTVAFSACQQEEELGLPRISVDPQELSFDQGEGTQSVNLLATRDWLVQSCPEWLAPGLTEGKASTKTQSVNITANANNGYNREGQVIFTIGLAKCAVTVKQTGAKGELRKGSGTLEDPYTVQGVIEYVRSLGSDVQSPSNVYFKGVISEVATTYEASGTYGNATFYMVDEGAEGSERFYCFQTLYLGNRKWKAGDTDVKAGDEVIVCGLVVNYKGNTPETVSKGASFVYSLNGVTEGNGNSGTGDGTPKGSGTLADPYNPAGAAAYAKSLGSDVQSPGSIYIKGKITKVETTYAASGSYGNATFSIADVTDGTGTFYVFQTYYLGNRKWASGDTDVKVGDEVIVCGPVVNYKGNTPETVGKGASFVYSLNGVTDGGNNNNNTDYNNAPSKTVAEFLAAKDKETYYKLSGTVSNFNSTYCSFDLTDNTGTIYVYSVANKSEWSDKISNEATVVLAGKYSYYEKNSQDEVVDAYILSCTGGNGESGNGNQGQGDTGQFSSNVSWAKGNSCYDDNTLNVNGVQNVANLKFGTSSKYGDATVTLPAGTKEVTFYAIAWKGKPASLKVTAGSKEYTFDVAANDGAANTAPYNVTVTDSDKYSLKLDSALTSDLTVKVETYKGNNDGTRAFLFGVQAVK